MKMSRRALRMQRHHKRTRSQASLGLVSLMDIFTILVFFLLVHSSDGEALPSAKAIKLPESIAEKSPKPTVVVTVNGQDILVQGMKVASVPEVLGDGSDVIEPLRAELDHQAQRVRAHGPTPSKSGHEVTIMGDKEIPYRLLRKIMVTCVRASYENISLAVLKKETAG
jgi:biopolymer transport protein TolR